MRAPVFKGLRKDLAYVTPQVKKAKTTANRYRRLAVPKENILQLLPDAAVPTKEQLETYWKKVAKRALPYLANRPLKLVRSVKGTTFYHMGPLPPIPASAHRLKMKKREGGEGTRVWIDDLSGLLGLLEMDVIELHPWNATIDDIESADTMVFDLDPGVGIRWEFVRDSALALKDLLNAEGFASWPKLTGGKGVHLMVPLDEPIEHNEAHRLSRHLANKLLKLAPEHYTLSASTSQRRGRLFIDYLRNGRGTTAIGTYSPRAREGFPIAAPVTWKQIQAGAKPDEFSIFRLPRSRGRV